MPTSTAKRRDAPDGDRGHEEAQIDAGSSELLFFKLKADGVEAKAHPQYAFHRESSARRAGLAGGHKKQTGGRGKAGRLLVASELAAAYSTR